MEIKNFQYSMPVRMVFGNGSFAHIGEEARNFGKRALIVSYRDSAWAAQSFEKIRSLLMDQSMEVVGFAGVEVEPTPDSIDALCKQWVIGDVDVIIGFGGGSVLDAAKAISVLLSSGGNTWEYVGRGKVKKEPIPVISIPTTAGTGSEVSPYAIFRHPQLNRKAGIISPFIFPKLAVLDPELTVGLPPRTTAVSGIDAFAHALESYTSPTRNAMSNVMSKEALTLIGKSLTAVIENGKDLEARSAMLLGSTLAGIGIAHAGTGIAHALGATLGGFYPLEHGWVVGLALPAAIRYNAPVANDLYADVCRLIGLDVDSAAPGAASELLARQVEKWLEMSGLSARLSSLGVERSQFPALIADTSTQNSVGNNINPVDRQAIEAFYDRLF